MHYNNVPHSTDSVACLVPTSLRKNTLKLNKAENDKFCMTIHMISNIIKLCIIISYKIIYDRKWSSDSNEIQSPGIAYMLFSCTDGLQ